MSNLSNSDVSNSDVFTSSTSNFLDSNYAMLHIEELLDRDKLDCALAVNDIANDFEALFSEVALCSNADVEPNW